MRNVCCPVLYVCSVFGSVAKRYISPSHNPVLLPAGFVFHVVCFILRSCSFTCKSFQLMAHVNFTPQFIISNYTVPYTMAEYNTCLFLPCSSWLHDRLAIFSVKSSRRSVLLALTFLCLCKVMLVAVGWCGPVL